MLYHVKMGMPNIQFERFAILKKNAISKNMPIFFLKCDKSVNMILLGMFGQGMLLRFEWHFNVWTYACEESFLVNPTSYKAFFYVDAKSIL